jgi:hypothetical protein
MVLNKVTPEIRPKVTEFFNAVDNHFSFLKNYGFTDIEKKIATGYAVKDVVEVLYKNSKLNKTILIQYNPYDVFGNNIDYLHISLFKGVEYSNNELVLKLFIKKYKPELDIEHLTYPMKDNNYSFEININKSLLGFAYFLKDTGVKLIDGSDWEEDLFYDWSSAEKILYDEQKKKLDNG